MFRRLIRRLRDAVDRLDKYLNQDFEDAIDEGSDIGTIRDLQQEIEGVKDEIRDILEEIDQIVDGWVKGGGR